MHGMNERKNREIMALLFLVIVLQFCICGDLKLKFHKPKYSVPISCEGSYKWPCTVQDISGENTHTHLNVLGQTHTLLYRTEFYTHTLTHILHVSRLTWPPNSWCRRVCECVFPEFFGTNYRTQSRKCVIYVLLVAPNGNEKIMTLFKYLINI